MLRGKHLLELSNLLLAACHRGGVHFVKRKQTFRDVEGDIAADAECHRSQNTRVRMVHRVKDASVRCAK